MKITVREAVDAYMAALRAMPGAARAQLLNKGQEEASGEILIALGDAKQRVSTAIIALHYGMAQRGLREPWEDSLYCNGSALTQKALEDLSAERYDRWAAKEAAKQEQLAKYGIGEEEVPTPATDETEVIEVHGSDRESDENDPTDGGEPVEAPRTLRRRKGKSKS